VVDERRVRRLLQRISDDLIWLGDRASGDRAALRRDGDRVAALKYYFITAIEGCINVAQHLCASEGWGPPTSNADAMRVLARQGVLGAELGEVMARAVGFRDVLVHGYADVDDDLVIAQLDELGQLDAFLSAISRWIGS
jgi:uncharacterized protein YutE (UPF0331/DUF86 family)